MRIGRLQINWLKPTPKVERKLDLKHFHTFKDGTNIYTYQVGDLAKISGRYLDEVKNTLNFMLQYAAGPEQVKAYASNLKAKAREGIDKRIECTEALIKIHEMADSMPRLQDYVQDLELKRWHDLYTMFFVLDGEDECMFSPKWNARKIELLEGEPDEVKEIFFSFLRTLMTHFSDTYRQDLVASMVREREMVELAASLTTLTNRLDTRSPSAGGPESALKNTETTV